MVIHIIFGVNNIFCINLHSFTKKSMLIIHIWMSWGVLGCPGVLRLTVLSAHGYILRTYITDFLSFYRYWFHYTRECEFRNFDKIKKQKQNKKTTQKKHKNLWLNFCLNKECPKLLCGLGIGHRRRQTIPMRNSSGKKGILQGVTVCLVSAVLSTM